MVVVIGVLALLITGIVSIVTFSVRNSSFSQSEAQANKYSQEAVEWIRQQRDGGWDNIYSKADGSVRCMQTLTLNISGNCPQSSKIADTFIREATLTRIDNDTVQIDVKVGWTDSRGTHESRTSTILTNWKK
ncbi:MAG: hypothetical protein HYU80_03445 [Candidatus Blackburnbacteria bacterium]|nr:hypothetical protein [Candidatus Blackburnbacteria bacterium]